MNLFVLSISSARTTSCASRTWRLRIRACISASLRTVTAWSTPAPSSGCSVSSALIGWPGQRSYADVPPLTVFVVFSAGAPSFERNPVKPKLLGANNGRVVFDCKPRAAPRPTISWSKGTELLHNSSRSEVTAAPLARSRLVRTWSNKAFPLSLQALDSAGREFRAAQHH